MCGAGRAGPRCAGLMRGRSARIATPSPNLAKEIIQVGYDFKSFDHHEHMTHPSKLHLTATVASHHLNSNSLLQATMTPLPYW